MVDQIIDKKTVYGPGPMGDVTPEAIAASNVANDAADRAASQANALEATWNQWLSAATSSPAAFETLAALQAADPTGAARLALVLADGYLYYWDAGTAKWVKGSQYQSQGLTDAQKSVLKNALRSSGIVVRGDTTGTPYSDLDTLPVNTVITFDMPTTTVLHCPITVQQMSVLTLSSDLTVGGATQILIAKTGAMYVRTSWANPAAWGSWVKMSTDGETIISTPVLGSSVQAPYDDADTFPMNSIVSVSFPETVKHLPEQAGMTILTIAPTASYKNAGAVQLSILSSNKIFFRLNWGFPATWRDWTQVSTQATTFPPSLSMFGTVGVIGDSYASGQTNFDGVWGQSSQNLQWPAMLARKWGISMLHLAKPGLSTRTWLTDDQGLTKLNASDPQDLYVCCLGINDYYGLGASYLGTPTDMDTMADTFYGNYSHILSSIHTHAPQAKIIMLGLASKDPVAVQFDKAISKIADHAEIPFIEENKDPLFTSDYYTSHLSGAHPTGPIYGAMALAMERLIQQAIISNYGYFERYGFTPTA